MIFVRHGESIANAERRFTRGPHEGLTERGHHEARERGLWLAASVAVDHLYASPFVRAQETAAAIGRAIGLEHRTVEDLREQYFGSLHGQPHGALTESVEAGGLARWDYRPPEGETLREVAERAGPAIARLAERHPEETLVIVSHGGTMAALRAYLVGTFDDAPTLTANAGGYTIDHRGPRRWGDLEPFA